MPAQQPGQPWARRHHQQRIKIEYGHQSRHQGWRERGRLAADDDAE
jgi:hypothetical protein